MIRALLADSDIQAALWMLYALVGMAVAAATCSSHTGDVKDDAANVFAAVFCGALWGVFLPVGALAVAAMMGWSWGCRIAQRHGLTYSAPTEAERSRTGDPGPNPAESSAR